jgi:hypothetical protein
MKPVDIKRDSYLQLAVFIISCDHLYWLTVTYKAVAIWKKVPRRPVSQFTIFILLEWITYFLSDRTLLAAYNSKLSTTQILHHGLPQGSVLGPLFFILYTAELSQVVASHCLQFHQYADDCQVYVTTPASDASAAVDRLTRCLHDVHACHR